MQVFFVLFAVVAGAATYAVLSRRVRDGIALKSGLILLAIGAAAAASHALAGDDYSDQGMNRALLLCGAGLVVATAGVLRRMRLGERLDHFIHPE